MTQPEHPRPIRSFVTRAGRITEAQERALREFWPQYGIEFSPDPLDLQQVFGRRAPVTAEIGFGNGDNLIALATAHPERDYLGIEVHRPGVGRVLLKANEGGLTNLRVICHDAVEVFERQLDLDSLDEVLVLFPDPWPKKRHHKRRLVQGPFVATVASRIRPDGLLRLATDWEPYAHEMLEVLESCPALRNDVGPQRFSERPEERAPTRFERRGTRLGHAVHDLTYRRLS